MELNGGSVVAMIGKDCVAIASDLRLGQQSVSLADKFEKVSVDLVAGRWWRTRVQLSLSAGGVGYWVI